MKRSLADSRLFGLFPPIVGSYLKAPYIVLGVPACGDRRLEFLLCLAKSLIIQQEGAHEQGGLRCGLIGEDCFRQSGDFLSAQIRHALTELSAAAVHHDEPVSDLAETPGDSLHAHFDSGMVAQISERTFKDVLSSPQTRAFLLEVYAYGCVMGIADPVMDQAQCSIIVSPGNELTRLLQHVEVTYFRLQRPLGLHFPSPGSEVTPKRRYDAHRLRKTQLR